MDSFITIVLLALVASFLPLQFGAEISLLGKDDGPKKASSLFAGITLQRILVAVTIVVVFAGATAALSEGMQNIGNFLSKTLTSFGKDVTSGQHVLLDALLIVAGIALLIHGYRTLRGGPEANQTSEKDKKKVHASGTVELILFGLVWMVTSPNQWIFMASGTSQIMALETSGVVRLLVFIMFLLLSSLMIILPIVTYLIWPNRADAVLGKINSWINGALRYVVVAGLFFIGLYLIWKGADGLVNYFNA